MIVSEVSIVNGLCSKIIGLNNILIEMKNSMVNVLCSGKVFCVVWWLSFDLFNIIFVKNVLRVKDMLNSFIVL